MMTDTTSAGMPPIASSHNALDTIPPPPSEIATAAAGAVRGFADEGKAQVTATLDGLVSSVREIATKLESNGARPFAGFVHQAADTVAGWSATVNGKSFDDLIGDTRTLVRTSPAIVVGVSLAAGFVLARLIKAASLGQPR